MLGGDSWPRDRGIGPGEHLRRQSQGRCGDVLVEMVGAGGAGDDQRLRAVGEQPGQADLARRGAQLLSGPRHLGRVRDARQPGPASAPSGK